MAAQPMMMAVLLCSTSLSCTFSTTRGQVQNVPCLAVCARGAAAGLLLLNRTCLQSDTCFAMSHRVPLVHSKTTAGMSATLPVCHTAVAPPHSTAAGSAIDGVATDSVMHSQRRCDPFCRASLRPDARTSTWQCLPVATRGLRWDRAAPMWWVRLSPPSTASSATPSTAGAVAATTAVFSPAPEAGLGIKWCGTTCCWRQPSRAAASSGWGPCVSALAWRRTMVAIALGQRSVLMYCNMCC